jgi:FlaA1/EpsC-like NDP-sugar epimerase
MDNTASNAGNSLGEGSAQGPYSADTTLAEQYKAMKRIPLEQRLIVRRSPIHGWGLFSLIDIKKDDIVIEYSGLRPGEKLHEELLAYNEGAIPTHHEKLRIASARMVDMSWMYAMLEWVKTTSNKDEVIVKQELKRWLEEYTPDI